MKLWLASLLMPLAMIVSTAQADDIHPAYLQFDEVLDGEWDLAWKTSANTPLGRSGQAVVPENCQPHGDASSEIVEGIIVHRSRWLCAGSIVGGVIGLQGLALTNTDALVRISPLTGSALNLRLTSDSAVVNIVQPTQSEVVNVAATYTWIGVEHILFAPDHLFFVLALVLLISGWRRIVWTVTAFTVAHSVTLIGTTLGWMQMASRPVEAVIALSIVFLATEIIKARSGPLRLSQRLPWLVAFLFGLLHGFGFAGALAEIGLPADALPLALLTFNLGVELGQLCIVFIALGVLWLLDRWQPRWRPAVTIGSAYIIGISATWWFIERMMV